MSGLEKEREGITLTSSIKRLCVFSSFVGYGTVLGFDYGGYL